MTTIQDLIRSFSADYLRQTNLLIGEPTLLDNGADALPQNLQNLENMLNFQPIPAVAPAGVPPVEEKKERKKRQHDPNAPKRPLTPYFLYMQTARPIIAADLGDSVPKGAVQDEGQRRWASMSAQEKLVSIPPCPSSPHSLILHTRAGTKRTSITSAYTTLVFTLTRRAT